MWDARSIQASSKGATASTALWRRRAPLGHPYRECHCGYERCRGSQGRAAAPRGRAAAPVRARCLLCALREGSSSGSSPQEAGEGPALLEPATEVSVGRFMTESNPGEWVRAICSNLRGKRAAAQASEQGGGLHSARLGKRCRSTGFLHGAWKGGFVSELQRAARSSASCRYRGFLLESLPGKPHGVTPLIVGHILPLLSYCKQEEGSGSE